MPRQARVVVPDIPHHVTQRGTRRMRLFFTDADYRLYLRILHQQAGCHAVAIETYTLMPNHVHLAATPSDESGLSRAIGETHRRYALSLNQRESWTGHAFQERFASFPMDDLYFRFAARYICFNPVRAGLVKHPEDWPYSSAAAHLGLRRDPLITTPDPRRVGDWHSLLGADIGREARLAVRRHTRTGWPLGSAAFVDRLEATTGRRLRPRRVRAWSDPEPPPASVER